MHAAMDHVYNLTKVVVSCLSFVCSNIIAHMYRSGILLSVCVSICVCPVIMPSTIATSLI